ncbi:uncharacterized protein LOC119094260 [Pollicipes pollicipes]|uniref:uncharacterized protein LOC119094260 n=1 Tax=Pollicipes pollicipes TaxID=41117 RepID=UPI0018849B5C|nr:uncharacterized protein LOC119094260 [Pollicipes pollicipes]
MSAPAGDVTLIVLWYTAHSDTPVYSYDLRNRLEEKRKWHNTSVFGSRVDFVPGRRPAVLTLRHISRQDQGLYKCRVDFQHSRTRNALVNLTVIVAPEHVRIVDPQGRILDTVAGTFSEGDRLELNCRVKGGSPRPSVIWRSSAGVLPAQSQPEGQDTVSQYTVPSLGRSDLHRMLTCLATNTNLTAPVTSSVMIDMNCDGLAQTVGCADLKRTAADKDSGDVCGADLQHTAADTDSGDVCGADLQHTATDIDSGDVCGADLQHIAADTDSGDMCGADLQHTAADMDSGDMCGADLQHIAADMDSGDMCGADLQRTAVDMDVDDTCGADLAPLSVSILGKGEPFSAGRQYQLVCQCVGSRPPALLTWYLGSARLAATPATTTSHQGNVTLTTLQFTPRPEDNQKTLFCRCQNPKVDSATLEDSWRIAVHYAPAASVTLGSSLDPGKIKEGDGVYFECSISANPPVYKKEWKHNNRVLEHSVREGIIISNYSLVLQDVRRSSSGVYTCIGFNVEGDAESNPIFLDVKFAPVCRPGLPRVYGVAKREQVAILCDVTANPSRLHFLWTFNNTSEITELDSRLVNSSETRSMLTYQPRTEMDYGTIFCWATNDIGRMALPCVFHVIAAGPPDPLYNCSISNYTGATITVQCLEAFDGGLLQTFLLNVFSDENHVVYNKTSMKPQWHVQGLIPGQRYRIHAVALNAKGRSAAVILPADTVTGPEKQQENKQDFTIAEMLPEPAEHSPLLALLVGGVGSLVLLLLAAILAAFACRRGHRQGAPTSRLHLTTPVDLDSGDTRGSDVSPGPNGPAYRVYRIPRDIPALPARAREPAAAGAGPRPAGHMTLRTFHSAAPGAPGAARVPMYTFVCVCLCSEQRYVVRGLYRHSNC